METMLMIIIPLWVCVGMYVGLYHYLYDTAEEVFNGDFGTKFYLNELILVLCASAIIGPFIGLLAKYNPDGIFTINIKSKTHQSFIFLFIIIFPILAFIITYYLIWALKAI